MEETTIRRDYGDLVGLGMLGIKVRHILLDG